MNFKRYHVGKNLLDFTTVESTSYATATQISGGISVSGRYYVQFRMMNFIIGRSYTMAWTAKTISGTATTMWRFHYSDGTHSSMPSSGGSLIAEKEVSALFLYINTSSTENGVVEITNIMLNEGSAALPYEPYSSEVWHDIPHYIHKADTDTFTTLPAIIHPNDTTAIVGLKGQAVQSITPTPQNPVMPDGTGEKTGNLAKYWKPAYVSSDGSVKANRVNGISFPVKLEAEQTVTFTNQKTNFGRGIAIFSEFDGENFTNMLYRSTNNTTTYTADSDCYVIIWGNYDNTTSMDESVFVLCGQMLNFGSESLPYEPYGYKLNISSGGTTAPVYLGEVVTTRKIKKLVLDGTEGWQFYEESRGTWQFYINNIGLNGVPTSSALSNIAPYGATASTRHNYEYGCYTVTSGNGIAFQMEGAKDTFTDITSWKAYLSQQYAERTPVTVWYALATPETGIVNEPLMKVGDYADEVSNISIPITEGTSMFSVDTTVQPSEVSVNYKGWHRAIVHEHTNGQWT